MTTNDQEPMLPRKFALVADGDVFLVMSIGELTAHSEMLIAALSSDPVVVDATGVDRITLGWTWDGEQFRPPQEG